MICVLKWWLAIILLKKHQKKIANNCDSVENEDSMQSHEQSKQTKCDIEPAQV